MASGEAKKLVKYLQELGICNNLLLFRTLEENFQAFLTDVKVPSGFADNDYKLEPHHKTYKFRHKLVNKFIDIKKSEDFRLTENSHSKQFFDDLKKFVELSESEGSFSDFDLGQTGRLQKIDLFEENVKVKGVVVCKFSKKAKVCVLIKNERSLQRTIKLAVSHCLKSLLTFVRKMTLIMKDFILNWLWETL